MFVKLPIIVGSWHISANAPFSCLIFLIFNYIPWNWCQMEKSTTVLTLCSFFSLLIKLKVLTICFLLVYQYRYCIFVFFIAILFCFFNDKNIFVEKCESRKNQKSKYYLAEIKNICVFIMFLWIFLQKYIPKMYYLHK